MSGFLLAGAGTVRIWAGIFFLVAGALQPAFSGQGVFQGTVIKPAGEEPQRAGWIFVQRNNSLRRVDVARAVIFCPGQGASSPAQRCGTGCLEAGQEILVTASQDSSGEWRATRVEILHFATQPHCPERNFKEALPFG
jgi:hypothetical protein